MFIHEVLGGGVEISEKGLGYANAGPQTGFLQDGSPSVLLEIT